jgi:hypothetical protein
VTCEKNCTSTVPKIVFARTEYDFGKIAAGTKQSCTFDFINDGGKELVIKSIYASCGCTTTVAENTRLQPGQASEIAVTYQAGSSGNVRKRVTVYTNDPENPQVTLWVTAEITGALERMRSVTSRSSSSETKDTQPPDDTMPRELKQALRNLNKATGG